MRAVLRVTPVVGILALLSACSGNGDVAGGAADAAPSDAGPGTDATLADAAPSSDASDGSVALAPTARFTLAGASMPSFLEVPFPSDAYLSNGTIVDPLPGLATLVPQNSSYVSHALGTMNGFSRVALSIFRVDDPTAAPSPDGTPGSAIIDPATLPVAETDCTTATSSVYVLDLAPGASPAILPCRTEFHDDAASSTPPVIAVGPARGYVLQEAHPYAVVLTSRVKDTKGRALVASADMSAVAAGNVSADGAIGAVYAKAYTAAAGVLASDLATDGASIVAIAPYTTMKKTGELFALREALESAPVPALAWDATTMAPMGAVKFAKAAVDGGAPAGFTATTDAWLGVATQKLPDGTDDPDAELSVRAHDQIAAVGTAVFSATSYLQVKPNGFSDVAHNTFQYDDAGSPVAQAPVKIWVTFGVPTAPMPPGGYPTVILQHGISGSREWMMYLGNVIASRGWMFVAIDSVTFGARAPEANLTVDTANNYAAGSGATYAGPDGLADTENGSDDFFGDLLDLLAIGDHFRQAGFDTAQLVKLIRSGPDLTALQTGTTVPKIDTARIGYIGDSLGALEGTIAAAIEPRVSAWFMNVSGGSLFHELVGHSPDMSATVQGAATLNFGLKYNTFSWSNPFVALLQQTVEPGDPIAYAPYISLAPQTIAGVPPKARNVIQIEALWDEFVTDEAAEALARATGMGLAVPNVGSNADLLDAAAPDANPRQTPLANINPDDAGAIHDVPVQGSTAVLVQCSPCQHGSNLIDSQGADYYALPYTPPMTQLATPITFTEDYRSLQVMAGVFLGDSFGDGGAPRVMGITPPVRTR